MVVALNSLCAGCVPNNTSSPSDAQVVVLNSLHACAQRLGAPPVGMHGEGALKELFAKGGYVGRSGNIAPLNVDALALPPRWFHSGATRGVRGKVRQEAR